MNVNDMITLVNEFLLKRDKNQEGDNRPCLSQLNVIKIVFITLPCFVREKECQNNKFIASHNSNKSFITRKRCC